MNAYNRLEKQIKEYERSIASKDPIDILGKKCGLLVRRGDVIGIVHIRSTDEKIYIYCLVDRAYNGAKHKLVIIFDRDGKLRVRVKNLRPVYLEKVDEILAEEGFPIQTSSIRTFTFDEYNEEISRNRDVRTYF